MAAAHRGLRAVEVHKRRERYTPRRLHGRVDGAADRFRDRRPHPGDGDRVGGPRSRRRRGRDRARPGGSRPVACMALGPQGARRLRRATLRRARRRDELRQAPCRRAPCRRRGGGAIADRAEGSRGWAQGLGEDGRLSAAPMRRTADVIARLGDVACPGPTVSRRSRRSAPPACAPRRTPPSSSATVRARCGVAIEVISGDDEARLAYAAAAAGLGLPRWDGCRVRHGRRQHAAHRRRRAGGSTSCSSVPVGAVGVTERFGLERVVVPAERASLRGRHGARRGAGAPLMAAARRRRRSWRWGRGDQPRRRQAPAGPGTTSRWCTARGARPRRARPADRALPGCSAPATGEKIVGLQPGRGR